MKTNFTTNRLASIETIISDITGVLSQNAPGGSKVERQAPRKGQSCKGTITISYPDTPKITYAFYPSTALPSRLGSVAIYTTEISSVLSGIRMTKSLFGFKVAKANIEQGRRPFIDVTIIP